MTTREQLKRAVGADRSATTGRGVIAEPAPSLPERLYAARERKGVDLYRAERDTKIRARYLGALERGDYKELPGGVQALRKTGRRFGDHTPAGWRRAVGAHGPLELLPSGHPSSPSSPSSAPAEPVGSSRRRTCRAFEPSNAPMYPRASS